MASMINIAVQNAPRGYVGEVRWRDKQWLAAEMKIHTLGGYLGRILGKRATP